jgi:RimJ/RimL family protein N-acetyltransferase
MLETPRLSLDLLTEDDADFILALLNEPSFLRFIGDRGVRTADDARRYIREGPVASYERHGFGLYLVRLREDGRPLGMCGLLKRDTLDDVDIGFAFSPEFWGNGYARESASAVVNHARQDFALSRLVAIVSPDNQASIAVLEALGFRFEEARQLTPDAEEIQLFGCALS